VEATARELAGVRSADVLAAGWRTDPEMLRAALARPTSQRASWSCLMAASGSTPRD